MNYKKVGKPLSKRAVRKPSQKSELIYRGNATYVGNTLEYPDGQSIRRGYGYTVRIREAEHVTVIFAYDGGNDRLFTLPYLEEEWDLG